MICPNCKNECPDSAGFCGLCGTKLSPDNTQVLENEQVGAPQSPVSPADTAEQTGDAFINAQEPSTNPVQPETTPAQPVYTPAQPVYTPVQPEITEVPNDNAVKLPKKKRFKIWPLAIVLGFVAVVTTLVIIFFPFFKNQYRNIFYSNKDYMAAVINDDVNALSNSVSEKYDRMIDLKNMNGKGSIDVRISDTAKELLDAIADENGAELNNLKINYENCVNGKSAYLSVNGNINDEADFDASVISKDGTLYFRTDSTGKGYYKIPKSLLALSSKGGSSPLSSISSFSDIGSLKKYLPDGETVKKLIDKYAKITTDHLEDVQKTKKTVKFGDIESNTVELSAKIDGDYAYDVLTDILKTAKKDSDVKGIIKTVLNNGDFMIDSDQAIDYYEEYIDEILGSLKKNDFKMIDSFNCRLTLNVDSFGNVVCRTVSFGGYDVSLYTLSKNNNVACGIVVKKGKETVKLIAKGEKSGDKVSGDVKVSFAGISIKICEFKDVDFSNSENGNLSGKIIFSGEDIPVGFASVYSDEFDDELVDLIKNSKIVFEIKTSDNENRILIKWTVDGETYLKYDVKHTKKNISVPSVKNAKSIMTISSSDYEDLMEKI
ncbi:MAG: hypothetical protein J5766_00450, partial [Clostridia bacterium]|nr:hypothetical protein [Clostridia bacterium]